MFVGESGECVNALARQAQEIPLFIDKKRFWSLESPVAALFAP